MGDQFGQELLRGTITIWNNWDEAFVDVTAGIRQAIEDFSLLTLASGTDATLPKILNIPYPRNVFFTGREDTLLHLHMHLQAGRATALSQPIAMSGLGGIGKTQIAVEYAYRYHQDYQVVLWAHAENWETLTSSYITFADLLNLPEKNSQKPEIIVQAIKHWLQTQRLWLLILDNADELSFIPEFLPPTVSGHLLLTTRASALGRLAQRVEVQTLSPERGALLLLQRAGWLALDATFPQALESDQELAMQISQELGGLPLALDQAGAYLEETGCSLSEYQQIYYRYRKDLLNRRGGLVADHPEPVAITWLLCFERVEQKNAAAADLLRFCAFLDPDAIAEEILTQGAKHLGSLLGPVATNAFLLGLAVGVLRGHSLVARDPQKRTLSVHRLVQEVLRDEMGTSTRVQWIERAFRAIDAALPEVGNTDWARWERLLPNVEACAGWGRWIRQQGLHLPEDTPLLGRMKWYLW